MEYFILISIVGSFILMYINDHMKDGNDNKVDK